MVPILEGFWLDKFCWFSFINKSTKFVSCPKCWCKAKSATSTKLVNRADWWFGGGPKSTKCVTQIRRNNKMYGRTLIYSTTSVLIYKVGWTQRISFLPPLQKSLSCRNIRGSRANCISWALPGDNLGMTWALLWQNMARLVDTFRQFWQSITE